MAKAKKKQIAYCGIVCTECGAYIATQENDNKKRKEVAEKWAKEYKQDFKPEDINCDSCLSETGRVFNYCTICEIRKCGREKKVINCAYCDSYICEKLDKFFQMAPMIKANLEEIRKGFAK
jgi:hypothetical protein